MVGFALMIVTLMMGPFFQGLFFPRQQHWAEAAVALGFLLWLISYRRREPSGAAPGRQSDLTGWGLAGLLVLFALHQFWAVYPHGNLVTMLKYAAALLTYLAIKAEVQRQPRLVPILSGALALTALAVGAVGLVYYSGVLPQDEGMLAAIALVSSDARLMSTFEYHNALAGFLMVAIAALMGLGLYYGTNSDRPWAFLALPAAAGAGFFLSLCFLLTLSRGAMLTFPVLALLLVALVPPGYRLGALGLLLAMAAPAAGAFPGFVRAMDNHWLDAAFKWLLAGGLGAIVAGAALGVFLRYGWRVKIAVAAAGLGAVVLALLPVSAKVVPVAAFSTGRAARLLDMSLNAPNARIRLSGYMNDAFKIFADSPWLGAGGHGWERKYFAFQDFGYFASEVHNHYLQLAVELGIWGTLSFLLVVIGVLWATVRCAAPTDGASLGNDYTLLRRTQAVGVLALFTHSALDFDLSYLSILLWAVALAATSASYSPTIVAQVNEARLAGQQRMRLVRGGVYFLIGVITLAVAFPYATAETLLHTGQKTAAAGHTGDALRYYARAARLSPLHPGPYHARASLLSNFDTARAAYEEAIVRDPQDPYLYRDLAKLAIEHQRWDTAATAATNALRLHPFASANYTPAMVGHVEAAIEAYLAGDAETGRRHRDEALAIENRLAELRQRAETLKSLWPNSQPKPGAEYRLRLGQVLALAGNYKEALPHLQAAQKQEDLRIQADIWTYMVLAATGDAEKAKPLEKLIWVQALRLNPVREILRLAGAG